MTSEQPADDPNEDSWETDEHRRMKAAFHLAMTNGRVARGDGNPSTAQLDKKAHEAKLDLVAAIMEMDAAEQDATEQGKPNPGLYSIQQQTAVEKAAEALKQAIADRVRGTFNSSSPG